jgi:HSP20 family protein
MPEEKWRPEQNPPFRPIPELEEMRRKFDEDIVRPVMKAIWERIPEEARAWSPPMDLVEQGDTFLVKFDLPGVKLENIDVLVTDSELTVKGERPREVVKKEDYRRSEISYGAFYRSVMLPSTVDTAMVDAIYEDGVLRIMLQRAEGAKPRKVNISVKKGSP